MTGNYNNNAYFPNGRVRIQKMSVTRSKKAIDTFLMQDPEGLAVSAPEANAYEFQSSGVVEMLEKLLDKFIDERTTLEKEEMNSKHAYDMLMQDLKAQIVQHVKLGPFISAGIIIKLNVGKTGRKHFMIGHLLIQFYTFIYYVHFYYVLDV